MKNSLNNALKVLSKHTGLNEESALGVSVLNAMREYADKCIENILSKTSTIKSGCEKCGYVNTCDDDNKHKQICSLFFYENF